VQLADCRRECRMLKPRRLSYINCFLKKAM